VIYHAANCIALVASTVDIATCIPNLALRSGSITPALLPHYNLKYGRELRRDRTANVCNGKSRLLLKQINKYTCSPGQVLWMLNFLSDLLSEDSSVSETVEELH
jgi:hypothetical protein